MIPTAPILSPLESLKRILWEIGKSYIFAPLTNTLTFVESSSVPPASGILVKHCKPACSSISMLLRDAMGAMGVYTNGAKRAAIAINVHN